MTNNEERLAVGQWVSNQIQRNLQENEDLSNILNVFGKLILEEPDYENLKWIDKNGSKGPYKQARYEDQQDKELFKALQEKLKEHKGFWQNDTYKFWFHSRDESLVDRRKK